MTPPPGRADTIPASGRLRARLRDARLRLARVRWLHAAIHPALACLRRLRGTWGRP